MVVILIILGLFFALIGMVGCILPAIPGPLLSYLSLIILSYAHQWGQFSTTFLMIMAVLAVLLTLLDYVIPAIGAKKFGGSKLGVWGSIIGVMIGFLFFPPWGVFIGSLAGAIMGEILAGKRGGKALQVGIGVFIGNVIGVGIKLAYCAVILVMYMKAIWMAL